jgi:anti-sigma regulatory factor (Ser/Thr protein kinase)
VTDVVTLKLPREQEFFGVAHLVLGGLAARLDLTYDILDDMTTAIDELLERRESSEDVTLSVRIEEDALTASVGPFDERIAGELQSEGGGLGLRRVLETVVDSVEVSERDGARWVELHKSLGGERVVGR